MVETRCPRCAHPIEVESHSRAVNVTFDCPSCGASFPAAEALDPGQETAVLQRRKPLAVAALDIALVGHLRVSGSLSLEAPSTLRPGKTIVGRQGADITVADETLSAQHFEIDNRQGKFSIRDLGSTNGTRVNGLLLNQTSPLTNGDRIEAGQTTFVFRTLEAIRWTPSSTGRSKS